MNDATMATARERLSRGEGSRDQRTPRRRGAMATAEARRRPGRTPASLMHAAARRTPEQHGARVLIRPPASPEHARRGSALHSRVTLTFRTGGFSMSMLSYGAVERNLKQGTNITRHLMGRFRDTIYANLTL